jgi:hypothetical protein
MKNHSRSITVACFVLALSVAGCGDDGESLTATEFRDQANRICLEANGEIGAAVGAVFGDEEATPEQLQQALDTIVSVSRRQLHDIDALSAPSELEADVEAFLAEGRSATDAAEAQGLGFFEGEDDPWAHTGELAADLGLTACSGG